MPTWTERNLTYRESGKTGEQSPAAETFTLRDGRQELLYFVDWDGRAEWAREALGYTSVGTLGNGRKYWSRTTPFHQKYWDGNATDPVPLWCNAINFTGDGAPEIPANDPVAGKIANFDEAAARLSMGVRPHRILSDQAMITLQTNGGWSLIDSPDETTLQRYVSVTMRPRSVYQSIPNFGALRFNTSGQALTNTLAVPLHEWSVEIVHYQLPEQSIPWAAYQAAMGTTNSNFIGLGSVNAFVRFNLGRGRLIFNPPEPSEPYRQGNGVWTRDVRLRMTWRPNGANHWFNWQHTAGTSPWQEASRGGATSFNLTTGIATGDVANNLTFPPRSWDDCFRPA